MWYEVKEINLEDYDGRRQICPIDQILPLFRRTENKPIKMIEDRWLKYCNQIYNHEWVKIKFVTNIL